MSKRFPRKPYLYVCKPYSVDPDDESVRWVECTHTGDFCRQNRFLAEIVKQMPKRGNRKTSR